MSTPHRTITLASGKRAYQRYVGTDPTLADSENPHVWETVEVDAQGNPYAYRVSDDVQIGVSAEGGLLVQIAGVTFSIPDEQIEGLEGLLPVARADAAAKRAEVAGAKK